MSDYDNDRYVARGGTTALGIIGTVLGSLGTAGSGLLGLGGLSNGGGNMNNRCQDMMMALAQKDADIAKLEGEKYTDNHLLELYQYVDGRLRIIEKNLSDSNAAQAVVNCQLNSGVQLLTQQVASINNTLSMITKLAVPSTAVVDFGSTSTSS